MLYDPLQKVREPAPRQDQSQQNQDGSLILVTHGSRSMIPRDPVPARGLSMVPRGGLEPCSTTLHGRPALW